MLGFGDSHHRDVVKPNGEIWEMGNGRRQGRKMVLAGICIAWMFGIASMAGAQEDIENHPACPYCGMDRAKFAFSRILIQYEGGEETGFCSLHCAVIDMALKIDQNPEKILVGDYDTKKLIDAERAYWVMGGDKMGVMTARAKWAFETRAAADRYIAAHGGKAVTYDDAVQGAFEDMYKDIQMIRKKRQMMRERKAKQ
jgi:copper chaperone NosL